MSTLSFTLIQIVCHVTSDARPSHLSRAMLEFWEWPGDETRCRPYLVYYSHYALLINSVFLAGQFEYLMTYLKKLVPDSKQSFLMQFLSHVR